MNKLANPLATPATEMLRTDHAMVFALYHRLHPRTPPRMRAALARRICTALDIHAQLEEEIFYPALREAGVEVASLDKSLAEHSQLHMLIARLRQCIEQGDQGAAADQGASLKEALSDVMNAVLHHVADEETIVMPAAEQALSTERLAELCVQMRKRRLELAKGQAGQMAADLVTSTPGRSAIAALAVLAGTVWMMGRSRQHAHGLRMASR